ARPGGRSGGGAGPRPPAVAGGVHGSSSVGLRLSYKRSHCLAGRTGADPSANVAVSVLDDAGAAWCCFACISVHHNHLLPPLKAGGTKLSHGSRDRKDDDPGGASVETRNTRAPPIPLGIER